jgi:hypothetical protein
MNNEVASSRAYSSTATEGLVPGQARATAAWRYLTAMGSVQGWLHFTTAVGLLELLWRQEERGVAPSGIAEIGIHHGKSFLVLAAGAAPEEKLLAIDLFERQDLNLDGSGQGNREVFLAHVSTFFPDARVEPIACPSDHLWPHMAGLGMAGLRFFSIDGGHTRALTVNDLRVADAALGPDGICALDDVFNTHWTGVVSGLFDYFAMNGALMPFALLPNKLMLCRPHRAADYAADLRAALSQALEKQDCEFRDWRIDVYGDRPGVVPARIQAQVALHTTTASPDFAALSAELAEARRMALDLAAQVEALHASTSWRITWPLRALARSAGLRR